MQFLLTFNTINECLIVPQLAFAQIFQLKNTVNIKYCSCKYCKCANNFKYYKICIIMNVI